MAISTASGQAEALTGSVKRRGEKRWLATLTASLSFSFLFGSLGFVVAVLRFGGLLANRRATAVLEACLFIASGCLAVAAGHSLDRVREFADGSKKDYSVNDDSPK